MSIRRFFGSLVTTGVVLIVLVGVLSHPRVSPLLETRLFTHRIPTAPALSTLAVQEAVPTTPSATDGDGEAAIPSAFPSSTPTLFVASATQTSTPSATVSLAVGATEVITATSEVRPVPEATSTTEATAIPVAGETVLSTPEVIAAPLPTPNLASASVVAGSGVVPTGLWIPSIGLEAPVVTIGTKLTTVDGQSQAIWNVPDGRRVGWHNTSVPLGVPGNTVLNGHNTTRGEVFRDLYKVEIGAQIFMDGADGAVYAYRVEQKYILREAGQPLSVRLENARYIQQTSDERLTLITCHPYGSLANRLVLIAFPITETISDRGGAN